MRSIIGYAAIAIAAMCVGSIPASASWECSGPEVACGGATAKAEKSSGKVSYSKTKKAKSTETASLFDDEKPVKAKKAKKVVSKSNDDDDAPVKSKKSKKSYDNDDEGGGSSYQSGLASYYWEPQALASGGRFNPDAFTAAHKTLPFGTRVRVTNQHNGESVVVVINDRGPYVGGRVIDLSKAAAHAINMQGAGVVPVKVAILGKG